MVDEGVWVALSRRSASTRMALGLSRRRRPRAERQRRVVAVLVSWWRARWCSSPSGMLVVPVSWLRRVAAVGEVLPPGGVARRVAREGGGRSSRRRVARLTGIVPEQVPELHRDLIDFSFV
jgi:hypothetical protein